MTSFDTTPGEPTSPPRALGAVWYPGGVLYLATILSGFAVGLYPQVTVGVRLPVGSVPLPTLRTLAVAQVIFALLIYPLILLGRAERKKMPWFSPAVLAESLAMFLVTVPFYLAAGYLGDAVARDVIRTVIYVAGVWLVGVSFGRYLVCHQRGRWIVLLALVVAAVGLPCVHYIAYEFMNVTWVWRISPAMFAWETARPRLETFLPRPLWGLLIWCIIAVAGVLLFQRSRNMSGNQ